MTLTEYANASKKKRLQYRLYRNPVVMLGLGALFMLLLRNRLPTRWVKRKERASVIFTYLLIIVMVLVADRFIGWRTFLQVKLPVLCFAEAAGIWLFSCSISSQGAIGHAKANGSRCAPPWKAAHFTICLLCCGGIPAILAITCRPFEPQNPP